MNIELPNKKYDIIYADPPWEYKSVQHSTEGGTVLRPNTSSAKVHYPTMSKKSLQGMDGNRISADNCILFMWATAPLLDEAIELGRAWGFEYKTVAFVWDKHIATSGYYTLGQVELVLLFKRGTIPSPRGAKNMRQFVSIKKSIHSRKPDEIQRRINKMFPMQEKLEMFARVREDLLTGEFADWDYWGNEV